MKALFRDVVGGGLLGKVICRLRNAKPWKAFSMSKKIDEQCGCV